MKQRDTSSADAGALAWAMAGDRDSFALVVYEHGPAVHAYLARRAGREVADDLLTEVWLRAWRSRGTYDLGWASPRPWLYGIARNVLRGHWRLRATRPEPPVRLAEDPWPAVDERLDAGRLRTALERGLTELPDEFREVLLLVAWEQLSPGEVAVAMGLPAGTVRSRLHRARRVLQRFIDQNGTDGADTVETNTAEINAAEINTAGADAAEADTHDVGPDETGAGDTDRAETDLAATDLAATDPALARRQPVYLEA